MTTKLTVDVPDYLMERFKAVASAQFRTPEGHVLLLMRSAVDAAARGNHLSRTADARLLAAEPVFTELRRLHLAAGKPSTRKLAERTSREPGSGIAHSTIHDVLSGKRSPSWPVLEMIVTVLDGDVEHFRQLWAAANE